MTARILSGKEIGQHIRQELTKEIAELKEKHDLVPGLATVLVGGDPASKVYVGAKEKACHALGIYSERHDLPEETSQEELLALIERLNSSGKVHGILVQVPLPKHINEATVLYAIDPDKDVDGFHPVNVGKMLIGEPAFLPCTPHGIQEVLIRSNIKIAGADVVIVGRSNIVGKPVAAILLQKQAGANATVTVCHSRTNDIAAHTRRADILIVGIGQAKFITADMVKEGVVVIDAGINQIGKTPEGKRILVGDVDFETVKEKAAAITPVPGGIGPMTIVMLMANTVKSVKMAAGLA
ncbi:MAG: bifunctional methylenetetrahydrofolate dehydrogenase/methenyltetrahydrofolate cyclohydrolase FolD [Dehalococcoidales bacterium]